MPMPTSTAMPSSVRARSLNGGTRKPSVAAASEPRVAVMRKQWSLTGLTEACIRCASWTRNRCTVSRSSSRACRGVDRRVVSRSVGTSIRATASWASSSRRLPASRVAVRSAERIALLVGRRMRTGTSAADSRCATDCRQVNATLISSRRHSRSWNAASVAALAASSRTCTLSVGTPSSPNASSTSIRLSTSTLTRLRSWPSSRLARSSAAYSALPASGT